MKKSQREKRNIPGNEQFDFFIRHSFPAIRCFHFMLLLLQHYRSAGQLDVSPGE